MSRFLNQTMIDVRSGRESWRVFLALGAPSFVVAICVTFLNLR